MPKSSHVVVSFHGRRIGRVGKRYLIEYSLQVSKRFTKDEILTKLRTRFEDIDERSVIIRVGKGVGLNRIPEHKKNIASRKGERHRCKTCSQFVPSANPKQGSCPNHVPNSSLSANSFSCPLYTPIIPPEPDRRCKDCRYYLVTTDTHKLFCESHHRYITAKKLACDDYKPKMEEGNNEE